jgi:hypothetical protein
MASQNIDLSSTDTLHEQNDKLMINAEFLQLKETVKVSPVGLCRKIKLHAFQISAGKCWG